MQVIKASGDKQEFQINKIIKTCKKAGASDKLARQVAKRVEASLEPGISTREILDLVLDLLHQENPGLATRYNLKQAVLALGPAGFLFEKFVKRLLLEYGYDAYLPKLIQGKCVKHEVDICAQAPKKESIPWEKSSQNNSYMVECKYHNDSGTSSVIKISLYTKSRFLDLREAKHKNKFFDYPWLISNTKFSNMAIKYGHCENLRLLGWKYPKGLGLERLIEDKKLYPITILKSANSFIKKTLFSRDIITCQDFLNEKRDDLKKETKIYYNTLIKLTDEAKILLGK